MENNFQGTSHNKEIHDEISSYLNNPISYSAKYSEFLEQMGVYHPGIYRVLDSSTSFDIASPPTASSPSEATELFEESVKKNLSPAAPLKEKSIKGQRFAFKRESAPELAPVPSREECYECEAPVKDFEEINRIISLKLKEMTSFKRFETYLLELINSIDLDIPEVAFKLGVDKSYIYQILKGKKLPSRDKIIEIVILLQLTLDQVNTLLNMAGYTLYTMNKRDIIIAFCIENKQSLINTNLHLCEFGEKPL